MPDKLQGRCLELTDNSHTVIIMKTKGILIGQASGLAMYRQNTDLFQTIRTVNGTRAALLQTPISFLMSVQVFSSMHRQYLRA